MEATIKMGPGSSAAHIKLTPGESFTAEGGSMISMSGDMRIETTTHKRDSGSVFKAIKRMVGGENLFMNHYTAGNQGGEVYLATALPGDMMVTTLQAGEKLIVQGGSYVASEPEVDIDFTWQGFKSLVSKEGLFWLNLKGPGQVVINSFGAIYPVQVDGEYIVDTGHIVAFEETLNFSLTKAGKSWVSSILGGEGLVCCFKGKGTVWCQSHNPGSFGSALGSNLKPR